MKLTTDLARQVAEFHEMAGIRSKETPGIPSDADVKLRLKLIGEEFLELYNALTGETLIRKADLMDAIGRAAINVDLPEAIDALADLDYVIEGTRQVFGVEAKPIADAVHAANIAKAVDGKFRRNEFGKVIKLEGWQPPDIAGELRKQGWKGI